MRMILLVLGAAFVLAGCSSSDSGASTQPSSTPATAECAATDIKVDGAFGEKPTITIPDTCKPPTKLVVKDLSAGTGKEAVEGSTVSTNYLLVTWSDKQVLDNSFDRGEPFPLENLGHASVIPGWNQGMLGIKQGGRRLMIIPPDLGYGEGGNGVKPNETLVFVVDAVTVS